MGPSVDPVVLVYSSGCWDLLIGDTLAILVSGAHHWLGLTAEVVGRNRVRWSAAQLCNESALPRTTDSTP